MRTRSAVARDEEETLGSSEPDTLYVRVRPRKSRTSRIPTRIMIQGTRFATDVGWYAVTDLVFAEMLREKRVDDEEEGELIFDVKTREEALALEDLERKRVNLRPEVADASHAGPRAARRADGLRPAGRAAGAREAAEGVVSTSDLGRATRDARPVATDTDDLNDAPATPVAAGAVRELGRLSGAPARGPGRAGKPATTRTRSMQPADE